MRSRFEIRALMPGASEERDGDELVAEGLLGGGGVMVGEMLHNGVKVDGGEGHNITVFAPASLKLFPSRNPASG